MTDRVILHVGLPRCGSTSLQRFVFPRLNCRYMGKSGLIGIEAEGEGADKSTLLRELKSLSPIRENVSELLVGKERSGAPPLLVSDEGITWPGGGGWSGSVPERLDYLIARWSHAEVLVVTRPDAEWIISVMRMQTGKIFPTIYEMDQWMTENPEFVRGIPSCVIGELQSRFHSIHMLSLAKLSEMNVSTVARTLNLRLKGDDTKIEQSHASPRYRDLALAWLAKAPQLARVRQRIPKRVRTWVWKTQYKRKSSFQNSLQLKSVERLLDDHSRRHRI